MNHFYTKSSFILFLSIGVNSKLILGNDNLVTGEVKAMTVKLKLCKKKKA